MQTRQVTLDNQTLKGYAQLWGSTFKAFVRDVILLPQGLENQPFHDELDDDISQTFDPTTAVFQMVQRFFAVLTYPRDHGKSKHLSVFFPLWKIAKNHNIRILCISRTAGMAESFLSEVVSNIERNDRYIAFAKAIDPTEIGVVPRLKHKRKQTEDWTGSSITIEREDVGLKDPTICATGLFGQILSKRADLIICDDVVDQQNSATELQRQKVKDWIETTVIPVLVPGGTFIYLGNTWHVDDVVSKFLNDPRFIVQKRGGAILVEAVRQDLWQQWGSIMMNIGLMPKERFALAQQFYADNKEAMDEGWKTLWPERYPYSRLYFERLLNPYVFARMYQCFTPETLVRVANGLKQIRDIRVGDMVLTHKGRLRPVLRTMIHKGKGKLLSIKVAGFNDRIRVTEEHPIFTSRGWTKAGELNKKDSLWLPMQVGSGKFSVRGSRARVYGWYLAEGSIGVRGRTVTFSLATKEKKNIADLCFDLVEEGFTPKARVMKNEQSCTNITVCSKTLADELHRLFGKAKTKHVDSVIFDMPEEERKEVLFAYLLGDGHKQNPRSWRSSSVCLDLSDGIARLAESLGYKVSKRYFRPRSDSNIGGRVIKTNGFDHVLNIYTAHRFDFGYVHHVVEDIRVEYYYANLHNMEVAEDNSYSLAHFVAHNCDPSNRPDQVIKDEWIERALKKGQHLRFQDQPHPQNYLEVSAAGMDLAISQKESADDTAVVYLDLVKHGYTVADGDFIIRQIHRGKMTPNEQRQAAKIATNAHGMSTIRVESVGYQEALVIDLADDMVPVRSYHTGREKFDPEIGINTLAMLMELGKLVIPSDPTDARTLALASQLANEMRAFSGDNTEHTGDGLMALWFAYSEVRALLGSKIIIPGSLVDRIKDSPNVAAPEVRQPLEVVADKAAVAESEYERSMYNQMMLGRMRR